MAAENNTVPHRHYFPISSSSFNMIVRRDEREWRRQQRALQLQNYNIATFWFVFFIAILGVGMISASSMALDAHKTSSKHALAVAVSVIVTAFAIIGTVLSGLATYPASAWY